jgi:hypothetical protein
MGNNGGSEEEVTHAHIVLDCEEERILSGEYYAIHIQNGYNQANGT